MQVSHVDYQTRRIFLHVDTVTEGFDSIEAYREIRALRQINAFGERNFLPLISAQGNEPTGPNTATPRRAVLAEGARYVPYDTDHTLRLLTETVIPSEGLSQQGAFERVDIDASVDIDNQAPEVEIRIIRLDGGTGEAGSGGSFTDEDRRDLRLARDHARAANAQTKFKD